MFDKIFSALRTTSQEKPRNQTQRRYVRRENDSCICMIEDKAYPVENWGQGGILIVGDERLFSVEKDLDITIKFKLRNSVLRIDHRGRVVRKNNGRIAIEFLPLNLTIRHNFQQVVDDAVATEFANSQSASSF